MTLQEAEARLSELNDEINELLEKREIVLKEWNIAFNTENQDNIVCIDENIGNVHKLYLINGESKMLMCYFDSLDMKTDLNDFYKRIDTSCRFKILQIREKLIYQIIRKISYMPRLLKLEIIGWLRIIWIILLKTNMIGHNKNKPYFALICVKPYKICIFL